MEVYGCGLGEFGEAHWRRVSSGIGRPASELTLACRRLGDQK
jgi:hypothetical protein